MKERAVIYTRVSTEEQAEYGTSLAGQREACERVANQVGATIASYREDVGVSGADYATRAGLQQALSDLETGRATVLIVFDVTRLSRDVEHLGAIVKRVRAAQARLMFNSGQFEDTPEGEMLLGIGGVFSQYERRKFRERSMDGKLRRIKEGRQPCVGMSPFGYHVVAKSEVLAGLFPAGSEGRYVVLDAPTRVHHYVTAENVAADHFPAEELGKYVILEVPAQAPWVREIFARYSAGASLREIARWLQAQGVPPPSHAPDRILRYSAPPRPIWHANTIASILENPAYKGTATYGKRRHLKDEGRVASGKYKRNDYCQRLPEEQWQLVEGVVPALVTPELWEACRERKRQNRDTRGGNPLRKYLLTGLLICPECNRGLYGCTNHKHRSAYISYHCQDRSKASRPDGHICNATHYNEKRLVADLYRGVTGCPPLLEAAYRSYSRGVRIEDTAAQLRKTRDALEALAARERAAVESEIAALSAGRSPTPYRTILAEVDRERRKLESTLAVLEARQRDRPRIDPKSEAEAIAASLADLLMVLEAEREEMSTGEKNALLARLVYKIRPMKEATEILLQPQRYGETVTRVVTLLS